MFSIGFSYEKIAYNNKKHPKEKKINKNGITV